MSSQKKNTGIFPRLRIAAVPALLLCMTLSLMISGCGSGSAAPGQDTGAGAGETAVNAEPSPAADTAIEAIESAESSATTATAAAAATAESASEAGTSAYADVEPFSAEGKGLVIVLDPGHSSQVPGTTEPVGPDSTEMKEADTEGTFGPSSGLHEYELAMRVSQKLRSELEDRGYTVKLTHIDTVRPISCVERAEVANEAEADAFIRIHANGSEDTDAHGAMTICITEDNPYHPELYKASRRLSEVILDTYCEQTGALREKVWETDTMTGNNWAEVPTTLVELGYMTNPDEDLLMAMDSYQKKMVNAIADGLDRWFATMPEEEIATHPSLTGEKAAEADTSATSEEAVGENPDGENTTDRASARPASASSDSEENDESEEAAPAPASGSGAPASINVSGGGVSADMSDE